jgi:hypothetical protein
MKVSSTHELSSMDPVHETMDIFYAIFFRKIILKIHRLLNFFILPPELFQNYIFTPVILHLGP